MDEPLELRLLLVDDDLTVVRAYGTALSRQGVIVETASSGEAAVERVRSGDFDVVVCDIAMPGMTGLAFLQAIRLHGLDVPVILMTGEPTVESAVRAVEQGAFRYLVKPVAGAELWSAVLRAAKLHKLAQIQREALQLSSSHQAQLEERATLERRFSSALLHCWMACQPIIDWEERRVFAYEALLRSDEPSMSHPVDILTAAERLGRLHELGRAIRAKVAANEAQVPAEIRLFVNLHSADLNDDELYSEAAPLSQIAGRVVLEVTERAALDKVTNATACVAKLRALGFQIAIDDLGAGYSGLTSFTQLQPEIAKLDMSLIRDIDTDARRQSIVRSMTKLCQELGILVIAEGVETPAERDTIVALGCSLLQGYLFAKPDRGFPQPRW